MLEERLHYRACIVRAWREQVGQTEHDWRLTLEVPSLGVRQGFSSFHDLVDSLRLHLAMTGDADGPTEPRP
jgi:hypothetical protein